MSTSWIAVIPNVFPRVSFPVGLFRKFALPILLLQVVFLVQSVFLNRYYGLQTFSSISYWAEDGGCNRSAGQALGNHCFGDYAFVLAALKSGNPWSPDFALNYPATGLLPASLGYLLELLTGQYLVGLVGYLLLLLLALSSPWLVLVARHPGLSWLEKIAALGVVGPLSLPALAAFDRGNSVGFLVPALLLFALGIRHQNNSVIATGAVMAALIKPQFVILLGFFLARRLWRAFLISTAVGSVMTLLPYVIYGSESLFMIRRTFERVVSFGGGSYPDFAWPSNVSISLAIADSLKPILGGPSTALALGVVVIASLVIFFSFAGRWVPPEHLGTTLMAIGALSVPVSFMYYLVVAQVSFFLVLWASGQRSAQTSEHPVSWGKRLDLSVVVLLASAHIFSLSGFLLPIGADSQGLLMSSQQISPWLWLVSFLLVWVKAIVSFRKEKIEFNVDRNESPQG